MASSSSDWAPDFIVGVDFGMTCTGIAYSYAPEWASPKPLQHWPSMLGTQLANKVPSQLRYESDSTTVAYWGFQCESEEEHDHEEVKEFFKLNLDPSFKDSRYNAPSREDAMQWFQDYIHCVYRYTVSYFSKSFPRFASRRVEFVFSIPTTWKDPRMVAELRELIRFDSPNHRATIGLTEAEAAAVYASGQFYQPNDVVLVCDAGGGTMDVNILKLASSPNEPTKFQPLGVVEGKPVGSVQIDMGAHQLLCQKLEHIRNILPKQPRDIAFDMLSGGRFERFKCSFGEKAIESPALTIDVPTLSLGFDAPAAGISDGQVSISRAEVKNLFDIQIEEMYELLDEQINRLKLQHPIEQISFLVLSGGFGSSPYVRQCLKDRYSNPAIMPNVIEILATDEPQLAVVQGQVINRVHELRRGAASFQSFYSRASYGVICDQVYDPEKHVGQPIRYDERNKKKYAVQQIDWLIFQGDTISRFGIQKEFQRKINPEDVSQAWAAQIVMSTLPRRQLPQSMSQHGAKLICNLEVDMGSVERKPRNHRWYNFNPAYLIANFNIKVSVGANNDLQFELWNTNGTRINSENRSPLKVKWKPVVEKMEDEPRSS